MVRIREYIQAGRKIVKRMGKQTPLNLNKRQAISRRADRLPSRLRFLRAIAAALIIAIGGLIIGTRSVRSIMPTTFADATGRYTSPLLPPLQTSSAFNPEISSTKLVFPRPFPETQSPMKVSTKGLESGAPAPRETLASVHTVIAGFVYHDLNDDGNMSIYETPVEFANIELLTMTGGTIATTRTASNGSYEFLVGPGRYTIHQVQPAGYVDGKDTAGTNGAAVTDSDRIVVVVAQGQKSFTNNFGERLVSAVSGTVYLDANNDGTVAAEEEPLSGVTIELRDSTEAVVATTTSTVDGTYTFQNLNPGTYTIHELQPPSYLDGIDTPGTQTNAAVPSTTAANDTISVTLESFTQSVANNFGERPGFVAGVIVKNATNAGAVVGADPKIAGVTVQLLENSTSAVMATTTTDPTGEYSFINLAAGDYSIRRIRPTTSTNLPDQNGAETTPPKGESVPLTLAPGQRSVRNNFAEPTGTISGNVWVNSGKDALVGGFESDVTQPTVRLRHSTGALVATTTAEPSGNFSFYDLPAGNYLVEKMPQNGPNAAEPSDATQKNDIPVSVTFAPTVARDTVSYGDKSLGNSSIYGTVFIDNIPANGQQDWFFGKPQESGIPGVTVTLFTENDELVSSTSTDINGDYSFTSLAAGTYSVVETQPPSFHDGIDRIGTAIASALPDRHKGLILPRNSYWSEVNFGERLPSPDPMEITSTSTSTSTVGLPANQLGFSGYTWAVKSSKETVGPGPNYFAPENATVDAAGNLHLRITKSDSKWTSSEVINTTSLGYGTYRWTVVSDLSNLDRNVVLGLFTWSDLPEYANREIDIEVARWGSTADLTKAQFVVQPYGNPGNLRRFSQPAGGPSTLEFTWAPGRVDFLVRQGKTTIESWTYVGQDIPAPGGEAARMNLWQHQGLPPANGQSVDVVFSNFTYCTPSGLCK